MMYNVMRLCAAVEGEETEVKWPLALLGVVKRSPKSLVWI